MCVFLNAGRNDSEFRNIRYEKAKPPSLFGIRKADSRKEVVEHTLHQRGIGDKQDCMLSGEKELAGEIGFEDSAETFDNWHGILVRQVARHSWP